MDVDSTIIELAKESFHFSAAHFTMFSATEREKLHGHNYSVRCRIACAVGAHGLAFDYTGIKQRIKELCASLDERTLMPSRSPWLSVHVSSGQVIIQFAGERLVLPEPDVCLLPIANVTLEALAKHLAETLLESEAASHLPIQSLTIGVSSAPGVWAEATLKS